MQLNVKEKNETAAMIREMALAAREAFHDFSLATPEKKAAALEHAASLIVENLPQILAANLEDMKIARQEKASESVLDRLFLDEKRVLAMAASLKSIAALPDPVGQVMAEWVRPNGLNIKRVRVPIGLIGIIYEARPNVTAEAAAIGLKAGNVLLLRGGRECLQSSLAIVACLQKALQAVDLPARAVQLVPTTDREAVGQMLQLPELIDLIIPRGGKSLTSRVMNESRVPVLAHLEGLCHSYVDGDADIQMAMKVVVNAKMRRVSVCGATETLLLDRKLSPEAVQDVLNALSDAGCEIRATEELRQLLPSLNMSPVTEEDWRTEYVAPIISVKLVDGVNEAIAHINHYGSHHTDSIITNNQENARIFLQRVDSGIVLHNASTQFADGGEFGFGGEIGIATGRLHARGPVGPEQLTSYKYQLLGAGQIRPV
ncbi:MAG: glutamate-5-semialdehyde dehydrogenase [Alphaproteobacteria bacterium]